MKSLLLVLVAIVLKMRLFSSVVFESTTKAKPILLLDK